MLENRLTTQEYGCFIRKILCSDKCQIKMDVENKMKDIIKFILVNKYLRILFRIDRDGWMGG